MKKLLGLSMIQHIIIEEAQEISNSSRWRDLDAPGSAQIKELHERIVQPSTYREFKETKEGDYLLSIIEAYEEAFNDDWVPFEIVGLKTQRAEEFIAIVVKELQKNELAQAVVNLRSHYERLSKP